jgi:hypothetical protein
MFVSEVFTANDSNSCAAIKSGLPDWRASERARERERETETETETKEEEEDVRNSVSITRENHAPLKVCLHVIACLLLYHA